MYSTKTLLGVALSLVVGMSTIAQDIFLDAATDGTTIHTDGASFYDSGRLEADYSNFEDITTTICSSTGAPLVIEFFKFYLEKNKDLLYISSGSGESNSPLPGSPFTGKELKEEILTTGESCMTFRIVTDFSSVSSGWHAEISTMDPMVETKH